MHTIILHFYNCEKYLRVYLEGLNIKFKMILISESAKIYRTYTINDIVEMTERYCNK
jgi:hypothetical protein